MNAAQTAALDSASGLLKKPLVPIKREKGASGKAHAPSFAAGAVH